MTILVDVIAVADPALVPYAVSDPPPGRFEVLEAAEPTRRLVLEAVYEGYLLHYGAPRAFEIADEDLRLLAGDALYALGLSRLAEAGDLMAVGELADLITRSARAHAEGHGGDADAFWDACAGILVGGSR
jgi:hypothetical protein